ncbi:MAG: nucleotidyltransferase family protein [Methanomicrobiales archaeon]|jgi:predicted nucleotidyltransferase|nr:nucleotidyltransferase family protein [Methanomicrobiales archaeon]
MSTSSHSSLPFVLSELNSHIDEIREKYGVTRLGVFGSVSRSEDTPDSDIDILVDFPHEKGIYRRFIHLADELEVIFGRSVDLVTVKGLSPYIRPYVEREVIWIYG